MEPPIDPFRRRTLGLLAAVALAVLWLAPVYEVHTLRLFLYAF